MVPTTARILYLQMAVRPTMPTPMYSPGQGWVSTQCLALSRAACKPLFLPECQSTFRPQLLFSLPPFFSCFITLPATISASSSVWFWYSCSWLPGSLTTLLGAFSPQGTNGKQLLPGALQVPLIVLLRGSLV